MAAAAGAPPAPAPHNPNGTRDGDVGYRSLFDPSGREYIIPDDDLAAQLSHLLTREGWLYVENGKTINADPETEDPVIMFRLNPAMINQRGGNPMLRYWDFDAPRRGFVQVDSSGGTESDYIPPDQREDKSGGTGATGSGKRKLKGGDLGDDIRRALDPNQNGLAQSIQNTGNVLSNAFDPNKNGLAAAVNSAGEKLKAVDWNAVKNKIGDGLDPAKNGVSEAFNKFGGDARRAFEDLGNKIRESAQRDKAKLDQAFAPFVQEFTNPNSDLARFVQSAGIPISADAWKKKFEDPDTYFTILSVLVTAAASVCSAGLAGPGVFAATQALIAGTKLLTKAATGKPIDPMDIAGVVTSVVPGAGGGTATSWLKVATSAASKLGTSAVKEAAKNVLKSNKDGLIEAGATLATMSNAATPAPPPAQQNFDKDAEEEGEPGDDEGPAFGEDTEGPESNGAPAAAPQEEEAPDTRTPEQQAADGAAIEAESARLQAQALAESQAAAQEAEAAPAAPPPITGGAMHKAKHPFFFIKARAARMGRVARVDKLDPFFFEGTMDHSYGRVRGSGKRKREEKAEDAGSDEDALEKIKDATPADLAAAYARYDAGGGQVGRVRAQAGSVEQRMNALSMEMFGKPVEALDDDQLEKLDAAFSEQNDFGGLGFANDYDSEAEEELEEGKPEEGKPDEAKPGERKPEYYYETEVIEGRKPTAKKLLRVEKFMRKLKKPARLAADKAAYHALPYKQQKRIWNERIRSRKEAPGYDVPSSEEDTEYEIFSDEESDVEEQPKFDYTKYFTRK
jgi:hypothetical protein